MEQTPHFYPIQEWAAVGAEIGLTERVKLEVVVVEVRVKADLVLRDHRDSVEQMEEVNLHVAAVEEVWGKQENSPQMEAQVRVEMVYNIQ